MADNGNFTSENHEDQTVEEIIQQENESDYQRFMINQDACPACGHQLVDDVNEDYEDILVVVKYCYRCGWESEPSYE